MLDRKTREEMNALSQEVFGKSSRWAKLVETGYSEVVTEEVTELVPSETDPDGEGTERKVRVPVKNGHGQIQSVIKRHTVESVKELMLNHKVKMDEFRAQIARQQAERKAEDDRRKLAKMIHDNLAGSAVK